MFRSVGFFGRRRRQNKLQVADSHRAALHTVQARFAQHGDDVAEADMTMAAVKVREKASSFLCPSEVDRKHSSTRLQNPSHLAGALLARLAGQMMKHNHAQYSVELSVGKRQRLGRFVLHLAFSGRAK
jgi:hypothetical protein